MNNVVNSFNSFFGNFGPEFAGEIPDERTDRWNDTIKRNPYSIFLSATNEQEVINIAHKCKNKQSTDCHDNDMTIVKKVTNNIAKPPTHICNLSFQSGRFPIKMKIAKVIPIYKNESNTQLHKLHTNIPTTAIFQNLRKTL